MADMPPNEIGAVCRLCTKSTELLWVFNDKIKTSENFKDVIAITTGVEISIHDGPSQFVCKKCLECAIRMYQFRIKAQQSNKLVIEQYEERSRKPAAPPVPPPAQVIIHPSVSALIKIYPTINVPSSILKKNLSPWICLPMNFVEDYYRKRGLDMDEAVRSALKSMRAKRPKNPPGSKSGKCKEKKEKSPRRDVIDSTSCLVSPINIKVNNNEPNYQIVKKNIENSLEPPKVVKKNVENGLEPPKVVKKNIENSLEPPKVTAKVDFTESLGLLPVTPAQDQEAPTHEKTTSKRPLDYSSHEKSPKVKKKKKKNLFDQSKLLLAQIQQSLKKTASGEPAHKKQKMTEEPEKTLDNQTVTEANKEPPKANKEPPKANFDGPIELAIEKQERCYMCNVCNATEFDQRSLRRHVLRHMRCPFCKKRFKSLQSTDEHIKQVCPIATCIKNLPDVILSRVELDEAARKAYPMAFAEFFPPKLEEAEVTREEIEVKRQESGEARAPLADVIEILSDDEDATSKSRQDVIEIVDISGDRQRADVESCSVIAPSISLRNPRHRNVPTNPSSRDTEEQIMKALLSRTGRRCRDASNSTQQFTSDDIVHGKECAIRLKDLKAQLHVNKVPVMIRNGPFSLKMRKASQKLNTCPPMMRWDDLTPCKLVDSTRSSSAVALSASEKAAERMVYDVSSQIATTVLAPTYTPPSMITSAPIRPRASVIASTYVPSVMIASSSNTSINATPSIIVAPLDQSGATASSALAMTLSAAPTVATTPIGQDRPASVSVAVPAQSRAPPSSYASSVTGRPPPLVSLSAQPVSTTSAASSIPAVTTAASKNTDTIKLYSGYERQNKCANKSSVQIPVHPKTTSASLTETRQIVLNSLLKMPPVDKRGAVNLHTGPSPPTAISGATQESVYTIGMKQIPDLEQIKNNLREYRKTLPVTSAPPIVLNGSGTGITSHANNSSTAGAPGINSSTTSGGTPFGFQRVSYPIMRHSVPGSQKAVSEPSKAQNLTLRHPGPGFQKLVSEAPKASNSTVPFARPEFQKAVSEASKAPYSAGAHAGTGFQRLVSEASKALNVTVAHAGTGFQKTVNEASKAPNVTVTHPGPEFQKIVNEALKGPNIIIRGPGPGFQKTVSEESKASNSTVTHTGPGFQKTVSEASKASNSTVTHAGPGFQKTVSEASKAANPTVTHPGPGFQKIFNEASTAPNPAVRHLGTGFQKSVNEASNAPNPTVRDSGPGFQEAVNEASKAPNPAVTRPVPGFQEAVNEASKSPNPAVTRPGAGFQVADNVTPSASSSAVTHLAAIRVRNVWELK